MEEKMQNYVRGSLAIVLGIVIIILGGKLLMSFVRQPIVVDAPGALKTYTNARYRYSFNYIGVVDDSTANGDVVVRPAVGAPWKFTLRVMPTSDSASAPRAGSIFYSADGKQGPEIKADPNLTVEDIVIAGQPAQKMIHKNSGDYGNVQVVIVHGVDTITIFGDNSTSETEADLKSFLDGFVFNK